MGAPKAWTYTPWRSGPCDLLLGLPWWLSGKESACQSTSSILGLGRSPGEGNGNPLQYSCVGNPMDRGAWWATVHGVANIRHNRVINTFTSTIKAYQYVDWNDEELDAVGTGA